ncbi:hypothetical protein BJ322DRAFT_1155521 [Thelephora terrestris]|uniref:BTB domain-containing protein n=1 Tax=Thelephora terrestris TaxID=56493 RepID=A0A9P6LE04_9AGAM|nr:hypothetical protein BJ322DRAFT_1155521 [Thelephora terrestris]
MTIPIPLQEALKDSITSGTFVDTKFWVFSKRGSNPGRRVPRLGALLNGTKTKNLRSRFPADRKPYTTGYDYDDDSDLESAADEDDDDDYASDDEPTAATAKSGSDPELVTVENLDMKSSNSSDIIPAAAADLDSLLSDSSDARNFPPSTHAGKVAVVEDVAFITFQELLRYLYTNEIGFAPWGSTERRKARAEEAISEPYGIPKPSPKSIYRLADKFDIPELKKLALRQIQQDLSRCNITEEVFSKYTSWYPELRELELRQLARVLLSSDSGSTLASFKEKVKCYTHGNLPHGKHIIPALYELMESDLSVREPPLTVPASADPQVIGSGWAGLKRALISSLTSGTFLDSQFYAVESRSSTGPPEIRPIYFCSTVGGDFMFKLMACSSKLRARKGTIQCADGYDSDVDDRERNQGESTVRYPRSKCILENPTPPDLPIDPVLLLNCGAAKTWSAIFLYVYTSQINFASISSQGVTSKKETENDSSEDEKKLPRDHEGLGATPPGAVTVEPCSPKSVYRLANKVGLAELCDTAFKDIQSKLDENNIIEELFSPFTAEYKDIREMEHELFQSKLKPLVDGALISYIIEGSSSGEHLHRTAALELILERSIQERRKRILAKAKNNGSQPDATHQPTGSSKTPKVPIQQVQPPTPTPAPAPQPQPQSYNFIAHYLARTAPAPVKAEASLASSTLPKPVARPEVVQREEPPPEIKTNPPPSEVVVELVCMGCGVKRYRCSLKSGVYCTSCPRSSSVMRCVGCGTIRAENVKVCANCRKKFK